MASNRTPAATVRHNEADNRYELQLGGKVAGFIEYRSTGGAIRMVHTEVTPEHEGQGLAAKLVQEALDDVRRSGGKVVPSCAYVASFIERHPAYNDIVAAS